MTFVSDDDDKEYVFNVPKKDVDFSPTVTVSEGNTRKSLHLDRIKLNRINQVKEIMKKYDLTIDDLVDTLPSLSDDKVKLTKHRVAHKRRVKQLENVRKANEAAVARQRQLREEKEARRNAKKTEQETVPKNKLLAAFGLEDNGVVTVDKE